MTFIQIGDAIKPLEIKLIIIKNMIFCIVCYSHKHSITSLSTIDNMNGILWIPKILFLSTIRVHVMLICFDPLWKDKSRAGEHDDSFEDLGTNGTTVLPRARSRQLTLTAAVCVYTVPNQ